MVGGHQTPAGPEATGPAPRTMTLASRVQRGLLQKRGALALVFGLLLIYFLPSTCRQGERATRDQNLLQVGHGDTPACGECRCGQCVGKGRPAWPPGWNPHPSSICTSAAAALPRTVCPTALSPACDFCDFPSQAALTFQNLLVANQDHFELCLAKCRTSSQVPK